MEDTNVTFGNLIQNYKGNKYELILLALEHAKNVKRLTNSPEPMWTLIEQAIGEVAEGKISYDQIIEESLKKSAAPTPVATTDAPVVPSPEASFESVDEESDEEKGGEGEKKAKKAAKKK